MSIGSSDISIPSKCNPQIDSGKRLRESVGHMYDEDHVRTRLGQQIGEALRQLLSEKHLYQSVTVNCEFLDHLASAEHKSQQTAAAAPRLSGSSRPHVRTVEQIRQHLQTFLEAPWFPSGVRPLVDTGTDILYQNNPKVQKYPLPTIKGTCSGCGERGPFNPIGAMVETAQKLFKIDQWIYLSYQCQNCKCEPVRFLLRRRGAKFTLSGRDPFETVELPSFIPKEHSDNLRNALIASHAGQMLAGIFLMRVFIEQFWKSIPEVVNAVKGKARPTGDELGEAYKATLPPEFKERFSTLAETYVALSYDMHSACGDAGVFEKCHVQIVEHFDARRLFKLILPQNHVQPIAASSESVQVESVELPKLA